MPEANATYLPNDQALINLITDKSIDCSGGGGGAAGADHRNMKPEAQQFIKR